MTTWITAQLEDLAHKQLLRQVLPVHAGAGAWLEFEGRRYLNFGSSNYLGLSQHPAVIQALTDAAVEYGVGTTSSPLITGYAPVQAALDRAVALHLGQAGVLSFASGYAANVGTLAALAGPKDVIFLDALSHASLIDGARQSHATVKFYRHNDPEDLSRRLDRTTTRGHRLIVSDGVFSMDGDTAPLPLLSALAKRWDALLIIDDAHGIGVLGDSGGGLAEATHTDVPLYIGTYSKALGVQGGFAAADREVHAYLVQRARSWIFSSAMAPSLAAAALAAYSQSRNAGAQRRHLYGISRRLRQGLTALGYHLAPTAYPEVPIVALIVGEAGAALDLAERLRGLGLWVNAVRPPTVPPGTSRIRLSLMANHSVNDIDWALDQFASLAGRFVE